MNKAISGFRQSFAYVHALGNIYRYLNGLAPSSVAHLALEEILRSEMVLGVSCLDSYVHELVRLGIIETYCGLRSKSKRFSRDVTVTIDGVSTALQNVTTIIQSSSDLASALSNVQAMLSSTAQQQWLEGEISKLHSRNTFQGSQQIENAIQLISDVKLWQEVGSIIGQTPNDVKDTLDLIVRRRNRIVHEADVDTASVIAYGVVARYPISRSDVDQALTFISDFAEAVFQVVIAKTAK